MKKLLFLLPTKYQPLSIIVTCFLLLLIGCDSPQKRAKEYMDSGYKKSGSGDEQGALADFTKASEIVPDYGEAYYDIAQCKLNCCTPPQDWNGALIALNKAIEFTTYRNTLMNEYRTRGMVKEHLGDYEGRCADYKEAFQLGGDADLAEKINHLCK